MRLAIDNGRVIDPASGIDAVTTLYVGGDVIAGLGEAPTGFVPERRIDADGCIVMPGVVDLAARLREPGFEHKATIASETRAAASAGITTLVCPPDTEPPIDSPAEIELINRRAKKATGVFVYALGALTAGLKGQQLAEMAALKRAGVPGVSNALRPMGSPLLLRRAMEYAASHDLTIFLHPIDWSLASQGCAHEGQVASRLGLPGIPEAAETAALGVMLALTEQTRARVHFCRLSTARAVDMIARAQEDGLPVTADVAAHQLFLTEMDVADFNSLCHVIPPLRTQRDRDGLRRGLKSGVIGAVCSDHQPHEADAKLAPFPATQPGISALETLLPLTFRLVEEGVLSLVEAVARLTTGPAQILGISAGALATGRRADLCILDPRAVCEIKPETWLSQGRNTPFFGWSLNGVVTHTLVAGRIVHESTRT
ncbi:MAG: dihydroorotase [Ectothiorhodospiraceae bacterium]|jgi:dihydroorotase|nr:dihydroorotase [Ectothiorhodospiraceae bacterium]